MADLGLHFSMIALQKDPELVLQNRAVLQQESAVRLSVRRECTNGSPAQLVRALR